MRQKFSKLFVGAGIVLLFAGILLYIFIAYYIFSFSTLCIGSVFILLSKKSWKFKLLTVGIPLAFVGYLFNKSFTTPERYLIPENYRGPVYVIFNQKDGQAKEYEGGRRLYRVPSTGVLFTQFTDEQGWINQDYYLVSSNGRRKKLGVLDTRAFNEKWTLQKNTKEPPGDSLAVFNPGTAGTMDFGDNNRKAFLWLYIGTYNDSLRRDFTNEYIDSLQQAMK